MFYACAFSRSSAKIIGDNYSAREVVDVRTPAVIFSNAIGDHLLNLPALRALSALFPGRLTLICETGARDTFFSELSLRSVCEVDMHIANDGKIFDADYVAQAIRPCDLLISLNPWHSGSMDLLLDILAADRSIGFHSAFQIALKLDYSKHSADLAFDIPRSLDSSLRLDDFAAPPVFPRQYLDQARRIRQAVSPDFQVLAVHADTQLEKMWPSYHLASLLRTFLGKHPNFVVFVLGLKDLHLDSGEDTSPIIPCYGLSIAAAICLVAQTDLFLGVDSCMLHAADLFRIPGVGLFGPTNSEERGFRFGRGRHVCGLGSMKNISEHAVLQALESLVAETSQ